MAWLGVLGACVVWGEVRARVAIDHVSELSEVVRGRVCVWTMFSDECCVLDRNGEGT